MTDRPGPSPLLHPAFLVALAVLALNDHVLKWQFGTWWTGKLSDVAGVFLLPLLIVGLLRMVPPGRRLLSRKPTAVHAAAIGVTAIGFVLVKTIPAVDRAYEVTVGTLRWVGRSAPVLWGGEVAAWRPIIVTPDPTDLIVLPVLAASWWVFSSALRPTPREPARSELLPS